MLDYTAKGWFKPQPVNLNFLAGKMKEMLSAIVSEKVTLELTLADSLCLIQGNLSQLRQILTSLVINADEAISPNEGTINISTGAMECSTDYLATCWHNDNVSEGYYGYIEISDTGCGMDKEVIAKLFDPFFSTKFTGRGMSLASLLGIVRLHKGTVHITSKPGIGSKFRILLPSIQESEISDNGVKHV
jgi:signal transduction histidine kinase